MTKEIIYKTLKLILNHEISLKIPKIIKEKKYILLKFWTNIQDTRFEVRRVSDTPRVDRAIPFIIFTILGTIRFKFLLFTALTNDTNETRIGFKF